MDWFLNVNQIVRNVSRTFRTRRNRLSRENRFEHEYRGEYPPRFGIIHSPRTVYMQIREQYPTLRKENGGIRSWGELSREETVFFYFLRSFERKRKVIEFEKLPCMEQEAYYEVAEFQATQRKTEATLNGRPKRPPNALNLYVRDFFVLVYTGEMPLAPLLYTNDTVPKRYKTAVGAMSGKWRDLIPSTKEEYREAATYFSDRYKRRLAGWNEKEKIRKKEERKREKELKKQESLNLKTGGHKSNTSSTKNSSDPSAGSREQIGREHEAKQKKRVNTYQDDSWREDFQWWKIHRRVGITLATFNGRFPWPPFESNPVSDYYEKWKPAFSQMISSEVYLTIKAMVKKKQYYKDESESEIRGFMSNASSTHFSSSYDGSNGPVGGEQETKEEHIHKENEFESKEVHSRSAKMTCADYTEAVVDRNEEKIVKEETERQKLQKQENSMLEIFGHKSNASSTNFSNSPAIGTKEVVCGEHEANEEQIYTESEVDAALEQKEKEKEAIAEDR